MTARRRLTPEQRREIVAEARRGVAVSTLAKRFGFTSRAIQYTLKKAEQGRRDSGIRTETMSVTLTPEEMSAFDAVLAKNGIETRSDGMRRLVQGAAGLFQPDAHLADELAGFRAALNRVGNNVTQIAKRMNEANIKGQRPPFSGNDLAQMRQLAGFVLDFADQVDLLARRRVEGISMTAGDALKELADAKG
ncbi:transposase [Profundibacterium mesophilum]|uniref:Transposase family protein n=1 Tax=Profundibacterium mesophilum KAUST100406-0324 TaxID=1037889 RepID=A0A921NTI4_9RHOB|nr:transposase [Profundibacterium mesophilum]KAF0674891.1 transposase family protein [Profundibacterium mesophilum KAUST100406-0324]